MPYWTPACLLTNNGPQFVSRFYEILCMFLEVKHVMTTANHPQIHGQAELYIKTIITPLHHYAAKHERDLDLFVQPLTGAYNAEAPHTIGMTTSSLAISLQPGVLAAFVRPTALPTDTKSEPLPKCCATSFYPLYQKSGTTATSE